MSERKNMHARARERACLIGGRVVFVSPCRKKATENGGDTSDRLILCYNCVYINDRPTLRAK